MSTDIGPGAGHGPEQLEPGHQYTDHDRELSYDREHKYIGRYNKNTISQG